MFPTPTLPEAVAAFLFAIALIHTFSTKALSHLALRFPRHAGLMHLLGEVEVVFGFWALVLILTLFALSGPSAAVNYLESRNFTEPMFVFVIMVIAASRPILQSVLWGVQATARTLPLSRPLAIYFLCLALIPLLGSFITEPAAMALAAMLLRDLFYSRPMSRTFRYATLGVLFVNVSVGGVLTPYAAPPVLMVAAKWGWDTPFMLMTFGWKALLAVVVNAAVATVVFRRELMAAWAGDERNATPNGVPLGVVVVHLLFLVGVVVFSHYPAVFVGLFLFFLGFTEAYKRYQDALILREGLLVAFFLAGLVTLGGLQQWWLEPSLAGVEGFALFAVSTALTTIADNAALTYLGSLIENTSAEFKYALVAGAVSGGGLTVIANAPNPAGVALLKQHFQDEAVSPLGLLLAAAPPTAVVILAFQGLAHV